MKHIGCKLRAPVEQHWSWHIISENIDWAYRHQQQQLQQQLLNGLSNFFSSTLTKMLFWDGLYRHALALLFKEVIFKVSFLLLISFVDIFSIVVLITRSFKLRLISDHYWHFSIYCIIRFKANSSNHLARMITIDYWRKHHGHSAVVCLIK